MATNDNSVNVEKFLVDFSRISPLYAKRVVALHRKDTALFNEIAGKMLRWAEVTLGGEYPRRLFDGYAFFVTDVNRAQAEYENTERYQYASYAEVVENTYASDEFMQLYHWGVFLSTFAWNHHLEIYRFFRDHFLPLLKGRPEGELLELGCGSGVWTFLTLSEAGGWKSTGVDVSATSVAWARKTATEVGLAPACTFTEADAATFSGENTFQAGISCFLLEHLERPASLMTNLAANLAPGAFAFVTSVVSAADVGHIYEFRRESEIVSLIEESGFTVCRLLSAAPDPYPNDRKFLPRSVAMVLRRKRGKNW